MERDGGGQRPKFMPEFFSDETLYSLCARYHHLSGNRLAATTSHQLFGVDNAAMLHDFPSHLSSFEVRTKGLLGNIAYLAHNRTLLKFYSPYQPAQRIIVAVEAMAGAGIKRLKFRLGLPSSRIGAAHPLKACFKCIQEENDMFGGAYWHLLHQHPAVWICQKHDKLLMQSTGKSRTQNKLQWVLPHTLGNGEWKSLPSQLNRQSLLLKRLSGFAVGISASVTSELDPHSLRQSYLRGAKKAGWLTRAGNVRLKSVRQEFLRQAAALVDIPEFGFIESVNSNSGGFLAKLFQNPRSYLHPVKHILVKALLFEDSADFLDCYKEMAEVSHNSAMTPLTGERADPRVDVLLMFIAAGEKSLAQAARDLDVPYDIARYWLKRAGFVYTPPRPPKSCKPI